MNAERRRVSFWKPGGPDPPETGGVSPPPPLGREGHVGWALRLLLLLLAGNVNVSVPDYNAAACEFIYTFRKGLLGKVMLDQVE